MASVGASTVAIHGKVRPRMSNCQKNGSLATAVFRHLPVTHHYQTMVKWPLYVLNICPRLVDIAWHGSAFWVSSLGYLTAGDLLWFLVTSTILWMLVFGLSSGWQCRFGHIKFDDLCGTVGPCVRSCCMGPFLDRTSCRWGRSLLSPFSECEVMRFRSWKHMQHKIGQFRSAVDF